jgi:hypothetical protein
LFLSTCSLFCLVEEWTYYKLQNAVPAVAVYMYTNILKRFLSPTRPHWGQLTLQFIAYKGSRGKAAGAWGWPLISFQSEVMNWRSYTVTHPTPMYRKSRTRQTLFSSWTWRSSWCHILIRLATTVNFAFISVLSAQLVVSLQRLVAKFEIQRVDNWLACLRACTCWAECSCLFEARLGHWTVLAYVWKWEWVVRSMEVQTQSTPKSWPGYFQ